MDEKRKEEEVDDAKLNQLFEAKVSEYLDKIVKPMEERVDTLTQENRRFKVAMRFLESELKECEKKGVPRLTMDCSFEGHPPHDIDEPRNYSLQRPIVLLEVNEENKTFKLQMESTVKEDLSYVVYLFKQKGACETKWIKIRTLDSIRGQSRLYILRNFVQGVHYHFQISIVVNGHMSDFSPCLSYCSE